MTQKQKEAQVGYLLKFHKEQNITISDDTFNKCLEIDFLVREICSNCVLSETQKDRFFKNSKDTYWLQEQQLNFEQIKEYSKKYYYCNNTSFLTDEQKQEIKQIEEKRDNTEMEILDDLLDILETIDKEIR